MKVYDVVVLGSGCGLELVEQSSARGLSVALVEPGPYGGTCLNVGCIPSKMLISSADVIADLERASKLGVEMRVEHIDFTGIMQRMRDSRAASNEHLAQAIEDLGGIDVYRATGRFVGVREIEAGGARFSGEKVFVAVGGRPALPSIPGLNEVDYLTNETLLEMEALPGSLIVLGGGYIATEYAHFFAAMGTEVTVLEMEEHLVAGEEEEISHVLAEELSLRMTVATGMKAEKVSKTNSGVTVEALDTRTGKYEAYEAERLLVALGRVPNSDVVEAEKSGIELDERGYITVDSYMRTSQPGIWAIGDINGKSMFRHSANVMALVAAADALEDRRVAMDYSALPHAIYSYPQVASVGLTEKQAEAAGLEFMVARAPYTSTAKGEAIAEDVGFAKAIVEKGTERILGFHIVGPHAPILIQEVVNAMESGGHVDEVVRGVHIHPSLSELIPSVLAELG